MRGAPDSTGADVVASALAAAASAAVTAATAAMEDRKRSLRFTLATDIVLLQEVNRRKPWASPHGKIRDTWEQIAAAVTAVINERDPTEPPARVDHGSSKRRYDVLMEAFVKDELKSMRAKGSVELYVRREELLTDLSLQLSQYHEQKIKVKKQANANGDVPAPPGAYTGIKRTEPGAGTPAGHQEIIATKRQAIASTTEAASVPAPRSAAELERDGSLSQMRARELELAEKRLELDRARFESEREERAAVVAAMQANTTLLLRLVERLERPNAQGGSSSGAVGQLNAVANAFNTRQI